MISMMGIEVVEWKQSIMRWTMSTALRRISLVFNGGQTEIEIEIEIRKIARFVNSEKRRREAGSE